MKIGFSLNKTDGGPSGFLKKLRVTFDEQKYVKTGLCFNPTVTCNLFANRAYKFWLKPFVFRVDGIIYDSALNCKERYALNNYNFRGLNTAKGVIFQSQFSKKLVESILKIKPEKSTIIINGTDLTRFSPQGDNMRKQLNIPEDAFVFVTSAKWRKHKRLSNAVKAFQLFSQQVESISYLIVIGNTDEKVNDPNIIYLDYIPNNQFPKYLRTGNCYLFLSWLDPCPNSVVEAIACGLPVICSNQGGTREIVDITNGGIVADADRDFDFKVVDLYNPPEVNYDVVLNAMFDLYRSSAEYRDRIDTTRIDIKFVAKRYFDFISSCVK